MNSKLTILMPVYWGDLEKIDAAVASLKLHLSPNRIILAGPASMKEMLHTDETVCFVDGNTICPGMHRSRIQEMIRAIQYDNGIPEDDHRAGWLMQQFIKFGYALYSDEEEYLVWDSDVELIRDIELFEKFEDNGCVKNRPKFFLYDRHMHIEYLPTIRKLLGDRVRPQGEYTFVNHYMLFESRIVKQMLAEIEANTKVRGDNWWEKCIYAITPDQLFHSGFSEFETYGEYVLDKFPLEYGIETGYLHLLYGKRYFGNKIPEDMIDWAGKSFATVGYEKYDKPNEYWNRKTCEAFRKGKSMYSVVMSDIRRKAIKAKVTGLARKLKLCR